MPRDEIHETTTIGPIIVPAYDPETGKSGPLLRVAHSDFGIQLARIEPGREQLMLMKFEGDAFPEIWEFQAEMNAEGREAFDEIVSLYAARDHSYAGALVHPFARGIAVEENGTLRMVAQVDMKIVSRYLRDIEAWQAAARHFEMLRDAYPARDWFKSGSTCWVRLAPGYDCRHIEALTDLKGLRIEEGQAAYLQLTYKEYKADRLKVWEPQVLVTMDRAPVYDLDTDTIPGLTVAMLPDGRLNGKDDAVEAQDVLLHDILGDMPNPHEPFRWRAAIDEAMTWPTPAEEAEEMPAP
ncbi:hypothetical protein [Palleronia sp.]|uniref:hypothetical protein n=1 Tax=Palleronia sp. TaxID=1940284 RepID=UPI0035C828CB